MNIRELSQGSFRISRMEAYMNALNASGLEPWERFIDDQLLAKMKADPLAKMVDWRLWQIMENHFSGIYGQASTYYCLSNRLEAERHNVGSDLIALLSQKLPSGFFELPEQL